MVGQCGVLMEHDVAGSTVCYLCVLEMKELERMWRL